jgi:hypothetical protein
VSGGDLSDLISITEFNAEAEVPNAAHLTEQPPSVEPTMEIGIVDEETRVPATPISGIDRAALKDFSCGGDAPPPLKVSKLRK